MTLSSIPVNPRSESEIRRNMLDSIPDYYSVFNVVTNIQERDAKELADLAASVYDVLAQFYVNTATWGLADWERVLGIETDESKPQEERRSVVMSKMRGTGTVTVSLIESVAESYDGGDIEVTEDPSTYSITVKFVSTVGIPPNLDDLKRAVREIVPAHIEIQYEYSYLLIEQIHGVMTLNEIQTHKLTDFAPFVIN